MTPGTTAWPEQAALRVEIECRVEAVRPAVTRILTFLQGEAVDEEALAACELALVEASNNAIDHVSAAGAALPIVLEAVCGSNQICLRVEDHTEGFNWPGHPSLPPDDSEHGRGLFLISSLMNSADYLRGQSANCLVMRRARKPSAKEVSVSAVDRAELREKLEQSEKIIRDMADELSSCYESLAAIFRYSGEQSGAGGVQDFTRRLLADLLQVTKTSWYVLRLLDVESSRLVGSASSDDAMTLEPLDLVKGGEGNSFLEVQAAMGHRDMWFERVSTLPENDPLARMGERAYGLVHPLYLGKDLVGTLAIGGVGGDRRFTAAATSVVQTFGDFLAIQVVNARFREARLRNMLVAQELEIAKKIQRSLLPTSLPQWTGLLLLGSCESASEVGGDFYDVIPLSDASFLVIVSDAMGKGLPAAMFAMILRSLVRALQDQGERPGRLLRRANELLYEELSRVEMFITAQVAYVDTREGRLTVANAGHCPLLYAPGPEEPVEALSPDGMPLGVMQEAEFEEETLSLASGGRALMYTDGVTETVRVGNEFFGQSRLAKWLQEQTKLRAEAEAMRDSLVQTLAEHQGSPVLVDDQTFVILGR
jgi:serine phosphatase RsbU (regulator of sigma subunit)/anti-sigma regulatory factor (Ser/Thr protein kinase)